MITISAQPAFLREVNNGLHQARAMYGPLMLAGGAPRNAYFGVPVRDIDIFFEREGSAEGIMRHLRLTCIREPLGGEALAGYSDASPIMKEFGEIKVWKCEEAPLTHWLYPIDLIWVPSIAKRIAYFPDFISRFYVNTLGGSIQYMPEAMEDWVHSKIRYHGSRMRQARLERLQQLFPEFKLIDLDNDLKITLDPKAKRKGRKLEPDYAPLWWDTPILDPDKVQDITRILCGGREKLK